jgi:hypothetical protein
LLDTTGPDAYDVVGTWLTADRLRSRGKGASGLKVGQETGRIRRNFLREEVARQRGALEEIACAARHDVPAQKPEGAVERCDLETRRLDWLFHAVDELGRVQVVRLHAESSTVVRGHD